MVLFSTQKVSYVILRINLFVEYYKHNIKHEVMVLDLCVMRQGNNENLEKFIIRFKKTWQQIKTKITKKEVNNKVDIEDNE